MPNSLAIAGSGARTLGPAAISSAIAVAMASMGACRADTTLMPSSAGQVVYSTRMPLARASSTHSPNVSCRDDATSRSAAESTAATSCRSPAKIT